MDRNVDVVIAGGGLVGSSLAIALDGCGLSVALIEAAAPRVDAQPSYDERNLALARASVNALTALGVWPRVAARATPIRRVHVSRAGEFGALRIDAASLGVDALGAVVPARELGNGLLQQLEQCTTLIRRAPAKVASLVPSDERIALSIEGADGVETLHARLVVGADGTGSFVRSACGIGTQTHDYGQTLIVTTVTPERALDGCAYERFSDSGPVALLPLTERRAGLVLGVVNDEAEAIGKMDDAAFAAYAQERVGWRAGRLTRPGRRQAHAIRRVVADALVAPRAVVVGNAAQTIHPIGAQGFNLGLRDALTLAERVIAAARAGSDPGAADLLAGYVQARHEDRDGTLAFSDGLVRLACNPAASLSPLRTLGLLLMDGIGPVKRAFARRGMGFRGVPTAYALGLKP
jgi:2-octaprenyl-6-methoxyphenol hydroxylase